MTVRKLVLDGKGNIPTVPDPIAVPLAQTSADVPHQQLLACDTIVGHGRRVLWMLDMQGATNFLVPDGEDTESGTRIYPDQDTPRVVGRVQAELSPGSLVQLHVLAAPSGPTQLAETPSEFVPDHGGGTVRAVITYTSADGLETKEVVALVPIPKSLLAFGAEPTNVVMAATRGSSMPLPGPLIPNEEEWAKWLGAGVRLEARIEYIGSPRVLECALLERPVSVYADVADDWPTALYVDSSGDPLGAPASEYAIVQASLLDKGYGTHAIEEAIVAHGDLLGPVLWTWSSATEHLHDLQEWISYDTGATGDDEAPAFTVEGDVPAKLPTSSGWSTAGHGPTIEQSGEEMLDLRTGVLPVWIAAWWKVSASPHEGVLEVGSSDWDRVQLTTDSTDYVWSIVPAFLEVGSNPEDDRRPTATLCTNNAAATVELRDLMVFRRLIRPG